MLKKSRPVGAFLLLLSAMAAGNVNAASPSPASGAMIAQQNGTCTGVVLDSTGETVIGASVVVKGTTNGTITGLDGDFSLSNAKKGDIIQRKKSWLTLRALEKASDKETLLAALDLPAESAEQKSAKIAAVKDLYCKLGVDSDAKAEVVRYSRLALDAVRELELPDQAHALLTEFAEKLVGRAK